MSKLNFIVLLALSAMCVSTNLSLAKDDAKLEIGQDVSIYFSEETTSKIAEFLDEHPNAFGRRLSVNGTITGYSNDGFTVTGEFGIVTKTNRSLIRITAPFQPSQYQQLSESRYLHSNVVERPAVRIASPKDVKVEKWQLASKTVPKVMEN